MNRRCQTRHDVQLTCYVEVGRVAVTPVQAFTENVSRTGILMRWLNDVPLPGIDSRLILDIVLPEKSEFGQRLLRCRTNVVRVRTQEGEAPEVALRILTMRFVKAGGSPVRKTRKIDLAVMPLATQRVS